MFNISDYVVYKRDVCKIIDIKVKYHNDLDYYILKPIDDESLVIQIPVKTPLLRSLITKEELENIIEQIPNIDVIDYNDKMVENEYKNLLYSSNHIDLIRIIKTTYLRKKFRIENNKKIGDKDNYYFEKAEKYLYNEFSVVLGLSIEETKNYIINKLNKIWLLFFVYNGKLYKW